MNKKQKKLYQLKAEIIAAAGDPIRLAIIDFLSGGEQCVCDITKHVDAQRSNVSRHLAVLARAGIVAHRRDGLKMVYSLEAPCILKFTKCIEGIVRDQAKQAIATLNDLTHKRGCCNDELEK